jgi:perosamine synthetase
MPHPEIPWFLPKMTGHEAAALASVIDANFLNDGRLSEQFAARVAERCGRRFGIAVTSGTAAISLALMACGIGPGDEVIVPDLTFIATANAVLMTGATPVLAEVEPARLTLDIDRLEEIVGPRTRAVVPVDVNGRGADYARLEPWCRARGLALVCDAAEGFGSAFMGRKLGGFGDAGCFSFSPNKTITTGQGGAIVTDREDLRDRLLELKDQGRRRRGTGGDDLHPVTGFNFKFTDLQAAVGLAQLAVLDQRLAAAVLRDRWYREALANLPGIRFPDDAPDQGEVLQWRDALVEPVAAVQQALAAARIGTRRFWLPLHTQDGMAAARRRDAYPVSTHVSGQGMWLPSHFDLTQGDVARVAEVVRAALLGAPARGAA